MSNVVLNILSEFKGKKAFKQADTAVSKLSKSAKALGITLSAVALTQFSKRAVQAFAADERAAVQLSQAVKNLGLGFADARVASFIQELEKTANVADNQLRPAMQALLTTTGSLTKSQELLNLAIETSRGSGVDLVTTSQDIANAYVGNTRGLKKYYLGLTQAELKTASFATIQAKLNEQFSGSNAAYLDTTAGKIEAISIAAGNASEIIGGSLVNALIALSGESGAAGFGRAITGIADKITGLIDETARFLFISKYAFNPKNLFKGSGAWEKALKEFNDKLSKSRLPGYDPANNAVTGYKVDNAAMLKAEKDAKARAALLLKSQKANTAELKKQGSLKKSGAIFDMDQIQIIAALKGKLSDDERLRLTLQLALIQGNEEYAKKLSSELALSQYKTENLAVLLSGLPAPLNPFKDWITNLDEVEARLRRIAMTPMPTVPSGNVPNTNPFPDPNASAPEINRERGNFYGSGNVGAQTIVVAIDGREIARSLQDQSMSAGQVAYLDRRTGGF